jgi:hypothetical protein
MREAGFDRVIEPALELDDGVRIELFEVHRCLRV